jgi:hypothetical protein
VKISIQKSVKNFVSRCGKRSKKFLIFFDFCAQLPAVLIEILTAGSVQRIADRSFDKLTTGKLRIGILKKIVCKRSKTYKNCIQTSILFGTSFAICFSRLGPAVTGRLKEYKSLIRIINAAWDILKMDFYAQHKP